LINDHHRRAEQNQAARAPQACRARQRGRQHPAARRNAAALARHALTLLGTPKRAAAHAAPQAARELPETPARRPARRLRWIVGLAGASIALAAGAIPAVAAVTDTPVVYYACVTDTTGAIKIVSATATCGTSQHKISWNNTGPQGPPGVATGYASLSQNSVAVPPGQEVTVGTLQLPAGSFLVNVTAPASSFAPTDPDTLYCYLWDGNGGFPLNSGAATLPPAPNSSAYSEETIAITAATTAGGQMTVGCEEQPGQTGQFYVGYVSITATPVSTLQASGLAAHSTRSGPHAPPLPKGLRAAVRNRSASPARHH
jgi:hypothetical protein